MTFKETWRATDQHAMMSIKDDWLENEGAVGISFGFLVSTKYRHITFAWVSRGFGKHPGSISAYFFQR